MSNNTVTAVDFTIGGLYCLLSVAELLVYLPCLIVMRTDPELKFLSCYRMMFYLGMADLTNLLIQGSSGVLIATGWAYSIPPAISKIIGAVQNAYGWFWYICLCHVIAFNRCLTICFPRKYIDTLFSSKATTVWLWLVFGFSALFFLADLSPYLTFRLIPESYCFYYDYTSKWFSQALFVAYVTDNIVLNGCGLWYLAILIYLRVQSRSMTNAQQTTEAQRKERRLLYQAMLIAGYTMVWNQYWYLADTVLADVPHAYAIGNTLWISNSAVNPVVYLSLNLTIQKKVRKMLGCPNRVQPSTNAASRTRNRRTNQQ